VQEIIDIQETASIRSYLPYENPHVDAGGTNRAWKAAMINIDSFPTYGRRKISLVFKKELVRKISSIPAEFKPVIRHSKICAFLAKCATTFLSAHCEVNFGLVQWAHFTRAAFKHLDKREGRFLPQAKCDTEYASDFSLHFGENELSEMLSKYRRSYEVPREKGFKVEDAIFLSTGCMVYGVPHPNSVYQYQILSPEERKRAALSQYPLEDHPHIRAEYEEVLIPLWRAMGERLDWAFCSERTRCYGRRLQGSERVLICNQNGVPECSF
jgi:hypothetical protein